MIVPAKGSSFTADFSPQKMAALNQKYVTVSMKADDLDALLEIKRKECHELDEKIKGIELSRFTLENDKKRIMCQIKSMRSFASPSPSPTKVAIPAKRPFYNRPFSSPFKGRGACALPSGPPKGIGTDKAKKEKESKGDMEEGFDDDGISIEEAMLLIDSQDDSREGEMSLP